MQVNGGAKKIQKNYNNKKMQVNGGAKKYRINHNNKKMQVNGSTINNNNKKV